MHEEARGQGGDGRVHSLLLIAVAFVGVSAIAAYVTLDSSAWVLIGVVHLCATFALITFDRLRNGLRRPDWEDATEPWTLMWVGAAAATTSVVFDLSVEHQTTTLLLAAALGYVSTVFVMLDRIRARAAELATESVIGIGSLGLVGWVLLVDPNLQEGWLVVGIGSICAAGAAVASAVALSWMARTDHEPIGVPTTLLTGSNLTLAVAAASQLVNASGLEVPVEAVLLPLAAQLTMATLASLHPDRLEVQSPSVAPSKKVDLRRSLISLGSVLIGPILIAVSLATNVQINMPVAAAGGSVLSMLVALHMYRLVRTWGSLEHEVHHDSLTGLPNRALFYERLDLTIERADREQIIAALMFLDLDRFKNVNDSLGHGAGNELLIGVANRLREIIGNQGTVARLGGDEFAILLPSVKGPRHSEAIGRQILNAFSLPFDVGPRRLYMTPSIGAAHYPMDGVDANALLENADSAMYRAKEKGRNTIELYSADYRAAARTRLDLESALHEAINQDQLRVLFQPKVSLRTGQVTGAEALLRWHHPALGSISPAEFVPVAEESGLIDVIGEWVLYHSCAQAARWATLGVGNLSVAVNLSPRQFQLRPIHELVAAALKTTGLPPGSLELELTENLAIQDHGRVRDMLNEIRAMGVRLSIDDFGVGFSGLEYLDRFTVDKIKIDRKFVRRIEENQDAPIVTAVISMAKSLNLEVIAEGVETRTQLDFLRRAGCDTMQGFLFSAPLPPDRLIELLRRSNSRPKRRGHQDSNGPQAAHLGSVHPAYAPGY